MPIQSERSCRVLTLNESSDSDVPRECIRATSRVQNLGAIIQVTTIGDRTEGDQPAQGKGVQDEPGGGHLGLDLLEVGEGRASLEQGEDWVGEDEGVGRVPGGACGSFGGQGAGV